MKRNSVNLDKAPDDWVTNLDIAVVLELGYQQILLGFRRYPGAQLSAHDCPQYRSAYLDYICRNGMGRCELVKFIHGAAQRHRLSTH